MAYVAMALERDLKDLYKSLAEDKLKKSQAFHEEPPEQEIVLPVSRLESIDDGE